MKLVRIIVNDDGEKVGNPKWCLSKNWDGADRTVCDGEVFGLGEGGAEFEIKERKRGGITCENCLEIIKWYKKIKL